jgi:group I intron endonuclease
MEKIMFSIYIIKNKINDKVYIGQTKGTINKRWVGHKSRANKGSNLVIHSAMRLHGIENFNIELLECVETLQEANNKEFEFVNKFNSKCPNGYNMVDGGNVEFLNATEPKSIQHKQKIQNSQMKNAKPIIQFEIATGKLINEWSSGKELLRNSYNRTNIINLCKSSINFGYIYGFGWCYKQNYDLIEDKAYFANPNYNPHGTTIKCLDLENNLIKTYSKIRDAAKEMNCSPSSIQDCIQGRAKTCKGFKWSYA